MTGAPARSYTRLEAALGCGLPHELMTQALTHRSYAYEHGGLPTNERLEFLGDAVLGLVVTDALYVAHPDLPEGRLAKLRASVVSTRALAEVGRSIGLGEWVLLGRGELATGGADKSSILADTTEALLGAVWVARGHEAATAAVRRLLDPLMAAAAAGGATADWKTALQELTASLGLGVPDYVLVGSGPDHERHFVGSVLVGGRTLGEGQGTSKKVAEQQAAEVAWRRLGAESAQPAEPPAPR